MDAGPAKPTRSRPPLTLAVLWAILRETLIEANEDKVPRLGAALAFYSLLSVGPLLLIGLAVAGATLGHAAVSGYIFSEIRRLVGRAGAEALQAVLTTTRAPGGNVLTSIAGVILLIISSTGFFAQMQDALNTIWNVEGKPRGFLQKRLTSLVLIPVAGFLLLAALVVSAWLPMVTSGLAAGFAGAVLHMLNFVVSFVVVTLLFAALFKILPDVHIKWRDVWIGAIMTAVLFTLGKVLIGLYLQHSTLGSTYGVAGSIIVSMVWLYYSAQIFFLGAEFSQVYARYMGTSMILKEGRRKPLHAVKPAIDG